MRRNPRHMAVLLLMVPVIALSIPGQAGARSASTGGVLLAPTGTDAIIDDFFDPYGDQGTSADLTPVERFCLDNYLTPKEITKCIKALTKKS